MGVDFCTQILGLWRCISQLFIKIPSQVIFENKMLGLLFELSLSLLAKYINLEKTMLTSMLSEKK